MCIYIYVSLQIYIYIKINKYVLLWLGEGKQSTHNGICFPIGLCIFPCLNAVLCFKGYVEITSAYFTLAD